MTVGGAGRLTLEVVGWRRAVETEVDLRALRHVAEYRRVDGDLQQKRLISD